MTDSRRASGKAIALLAGIALVLLLDRPLPSAAHITYIEVKLPLKVGKPS